jgi:hypothetical protein
MNTLLPNDQASQLQVLYDDMAPLGLTPCGKCCIPSSSLNR